jgi:hypothetical protein
MPDFELQFILQSHSKKTQHGTGTKTYTKTSGTEYKTQKLICTDTPTSFLTKAPKTYDG